MGVIKKQTIQGTIITYIGVIIGFVNAAILMPKLDTEIVGLISILIAYTLTIRLIGSLGFGAVTSRLFAYFRNEKNNHNGFMFIAVSVTIVGFIISVIAILIIKYFIFKNRNPDDLFMTYFYYLIPLVFFTQVLTTLDDYYKVIYKAVRGIVLREVVQKTLGLLAVLLMVYGFLNTRQFTVIYIIGYCLPGFIILLMVIYEKQFVLKPQLSFIDKNLRNTMLSVGAFGILTSAIGVISLNIDKIMLESYLGLSYTGIYSIAFYFGAIIAIPSRSLLKISTTVLAESWKNNDIETIKAVYYKSSINQFIIGIIMYLGIIINLDNIFHLLTEKYADGRMVIIFIGLAFLMDMISGASGTLLANSKHYRYGTYIMVFYALSIIVTNMIFIPKWGITGAAFATFLAKFINNLMKMYAVQRLFKLQPFNFKFLLVLILCFLLYLLNLLIPVLHNYIVDILLRSSVISILFVTIIYILKISDDINDQLNSMKDYLFKRLFR